MRRLITLLQPVIYPAIKWYYRKPRMLTKRGIKIQLNPTVFHPSYYLSTDILLDFLLTQNIENKAVLELGTGNGFTALYLAKNKNTQTYASDINAQAVEGLKKNSKENEVKMTIFLSDLFDDIPALDLDYIVVNPPYFPKSVDSVDEYAFYTGENFEYFHKFFEQIKSYLEQKTKVLMILSENAAIADVERLSKQYQVGLKVVYKEAKNQELFLVYKVC